MCAATNVIPLKNRPITDTAANSEPPSCARSTAPHLRQTLIKYVFCIRERPRLLRRHLAGKVMHYFGGRSCVAKAKIGFNQTERNFLFQLESDASWMWGWCETWAAHTHTHHFLAARDQCSPLHHFDQLFDENCHRVAMKRLLKCFTSQSSSKWFSSSCYQGLWKFVPAAFIFETFISPLL